jgi:hypothetical protein
MQQSQPLGIRSSDEEVAASILSALLGQQDPLARYDALTRAQGVYEALAKRIAAERARAVAEMHAAGLSYGRIAETIGFTRARAQQLVERAGPPEMTGTRERRKSMASQAEITDFLERFAADWPRLRELFPNNWTGLWPQMRLVSEQRSVEQIALNLFTNAEFRALQLGDWLNTPDGELLVAAAEAIAPSLYRQDIELLVAALKLAAKMQQDDGRKRAATAALLVAAGGALLVASRG